MSHFLCHGPYNDVSTSWWSSVATWSLLSLLSRFTIESTLSFRRILPSRSCAARVTPSWWSFSPSLWLDLHSWPLLLRYGSKTTWSKEIRILKQLDKQLRLRTFSAAAPNYSLISSWFTTCLSVKAASNSSNNLRVPKFPLKNLKIVWKSQNLKLCLLTLKTSWL